ncbi:phosphotransferase [Streptomyces clavuligerus]|uniref:phosphotransferase n=1 Tax=Streptomyces clavuligerus TaxID=1901 RepID=UPI001F07EFDD|nr:phosphotransferase [Streptomyces clavuligerus]
MAATTTAEQPARTASAGPPGALAPFPLDHAPEVATALDRLRIAPLVPSTLSGLPGRNDNWSGLTEDGRAVFVKRLAQPGAQDRFDRALAFERARSAAGTLSWRAPRFLGGDRENGVLVHERLDGPVTAAALADEGRHTPDLARRTGRAVAELHSLPYAEATSGATSRATTEVTSGSGGGSQAGGGTAAGEGGRNRVGSSAPPHPATTALSLDTYLRGSGAELEAWALLQQDRRVVAALTGLAEAAAAAPRLPGHGDLRLDQLLLIGDELYLTDWEEFRPADPARTSAATSASGSTRAANPPCSANSTPIPSADPRRGPTRPSSATGSGSSPPSAPGSAPSGRATARRPPRGAAD